MDVDHPEPAGPPVPLGPPVGPRPAAPVAGRPGVRARRSAHVDPPASQPRMASEKREHQPTPERAETPPERAVKRERKVGPERAVKRERKMDQERDVKRERKVGPSRSLRSPQPPPPPLYQSPDCDDPAVRDRIRPFDPGQELQSPVNDGSAIPLPESGGDLGDGRVNGEDNAHSAYAAHLNVESASNRGYCPNFTLKDSNSIQKGTQTALEGDVHRDRDRLA